MWLVPLRDNLQEWLIRSWDTDNVGNSTNLWVIFNGKCSSSLFFPFLEKVRCHSTGDASDILASVTACSGYLISPQPGNNMENVEVGVIEPQLCYTCYVSQNTICCLPKVSAANMFLNVTTHSFHNIAPLPRTLVFEASFDWLGHLL